MAKLRLPPQSDKLDQARYEAALKRPAQAIGDITVAVVVPEDVDLTAEELAAIEEQARLEQALRMARLDSLGQSLARKRKAAIEGRAASGIEQEWMEDQDAYEGIDEANRTTETGHRAGRFHKPTTKEGTLTREPVSANRSTALLNITRPYTDAASARLGDMILPLDDRPWSLKPTPVPELIRHLDEPQPLNAGGELGAAMTAEGQAAPNSVAAPEMPPVQSGMLPPEPPKGPAQTTGDLAKEAMKKAEKAAEKAQTRIDDWHTETQWHSKARTIIDDAARMGTGILKGPHPTWRKQSAWVKDASGNPVLQVKEEIKPGTSVVNCWNFYPDALCGENIHNGSFTWERDDITAKVLRELKGTDGAIDEQIEACLLEGPAKPEVDATSRGGADRVIADDTPFEIWYFHGTIEKEDMEAAGCECAEQSVYIPAVITMVNDRVVRAALNPLDCGEFPYDLMLWQKRAGMPWGIGVPRQLRTPQRMLTAANRNLLENGGLSSGPQIIVMRSVIDPADGQWELTPRKFWWAKAEASIADLRSAFLSVNIDSRQQELMAIIQFSMKVAEDVTGMPALLQGQQGNAPDILGVVQILNNNASAVARRLARTFDAAITEPHVGRYYQWLLQHGEDDEEKGEFIIDARASTVLVERDIQKQSLVQMAPLVQNPQYGINPRKYFAQLCKANRLNPLDIQYDEDEWKRIQDNMAKQPVGDPRIQVAQIRASEAERLLQAELAFDAREKEKDRQLEAILARAGNDIETLKVAGQQHMSLEEVKAMLAKTVMSIRAQKELAHDDRAMRGHVPQVAEPAFEPQGRAAPGRAYQA